MSLVTSGMRESWHFTERYLSWSKRLRAPPLRLENSKLLYSVDHHHTITPREAHCDDDRHCHHLLETVILCQGLIHVLRKDAVGGKPLELTESPLERSWL